MRKILLLALTMLISLAASAVNYAEAGDSAYSKKEYATALENYNQALQKQGTSSDLYYNIGNTYYRLGDIAHSVIFYERALVLDPSNKDARTNLAFVKKGIAGAPEDDSTFLSNIHMRIEAWMSPNAWAWSAFGLFVVFCLCIATYLFAEKTTLRKTGFFGGIVIFVVFIYVLVIAWTTAAAIDEHDYAVVTSPVSNMRSQPSSKSSKGDKIIPIYEGTKLQIVDSLATPDDDTVSMWYEARINNTSRAWINAADVERI